MCFLKLDFLFAMTAGGMMFGKKICLIVQVWFSSTVKNMLRIAEKLQVQTRFSENF